ncbi:MAG: hypothetical protein ACJ796_01210 [Gemmatimonadaceae bacterium]|jgi:hypothetical protein
MRRFQADNGALWDAVIGHESWGTFVVLFTPVAGGAARKSVLAQESAMDAETELGEKSDDDLRTMLADSSPW